MAPMRKPLFTKPAWASKSVTTLENAKDTVESSGLIEDDNAPVFGSKYLYEDIVAEERRKREKHAQRVKEREKKALSEKKNTSSEKNEHRTKRIKTTEDDSSHDTGSEKDLDTDLGTDPPEVVLTDTPQRSTRAKTYGAVNNTPTESPGKGAQKKSSTRRASISSDSETGKSVSGNEDRTARDRSLEMIDTKKVVHEPESDEEDEFLRDLKRKAREEARSKKSAASNDKSGRSPTGAEAEDSGRTKSGSIEILPEDEIDHFRGRATSTPIPDDPHVEILITTIIPNAKSVAAKRRASQPLDKLRDFFCQRNELNPAIASKVFFTWKGTRLYNSTTMRGILETLKRERPMADGSDPSNGKILLEAVTDEIVEYYKERQERRQREAEEEASHGDTLNNTNDEEGANPTRDESREPQESKQPGPTITLICPGVEEMSIRLRPNTSVAKIIAAFRSVKGIEPSKQCWLSYDGDRLEPGQTAEDIGFENEDTVDVYLR